MYHKLIAITLKIKNDSFEKVYEFNSTLSNYSEPIAGKKRDLHSDLNSFLPAYSEAKKLLPLTFMDQLNLGNAIAHLLPNSVDAVYQTLDSHKYEVEDASIDFRIYKNKSDSWLIQIEDNGVGFSTNIFEPFYSDKNHQHFLGSMGEGVQSALSSFMGSFNNWDIQLQYITQDDNNKSIFNYESRGFFSSPKVDVQRQPLPVGAKSGTILNIKYAKAQRDANYLQVETSSSNYFEVAKAYNELGEILEKEGEIRFAQWSYSMALEFSFVQRLGYRPEVRYSLPEANYNMARLALELNKPDRALEYCDAYSVVYPDSAKTEQLRKQIEVSVSN